MTAYDPWELLQIAESCNPPEYEPANMPEDEIGWTDQEFTAPNGWKVIFFYDAGELDYIDSFLTPDGQTIDVWGIAGAPAQPWQEIVRNWRSVGDLARLRKYSVD